MQKFSNELKIKSSHSGDCYLAVIVFNMISIWLVCECEIGDLKDNVVFRTKERVKAGSVSSGHYSVTFWANSLESRFGCR